MRERHPHPASLTLDAFSKRLSHIYSHSARDHSLSMMYKGVVASWCLDTLIIVPYVCLLVFEDVRLQRFGRLKEVMFDLLVTGSTFPDSISSFWLC